MTALRCQSSCMRASGGGRPTMRPRPPSSRRDRHRLQQNVTSGLRGAVYQYRSPGPPHPMSTPLELASPPPVTTQPQALPAAPGATDLRGRTLAMAVAPGVDAGQVEALLTGMRRRGAHVELVAPTLGAIETPRGSTLMPDRTFNACSPLDYDAVVVPDGDLHRLRDDGA